MKRISIFILSLILVVLITSCAAEKPNPTTVSTTKPTTAAQTTTATVPATTTAATTTAATKPKKKPEKPEKATKPTEKKEKATKPTKKTKPTTMPPTQGRTRPNTHVAVTSPPKGSFSANDLVFKYKKHSVKLNEKVEDIYEVFGDDASEGELSSKRTEYEYDDFIVTTYKEDKDDEYERIEKIEIIDDGAETKKGAKIGMYATRLKRLYGDPFKLNEEKYLYGSGAKTLTFTYEGNIVTGIIYKYKH